MSLIESALNAGAKAAGSALAWGGMVVDDLTHPRRSLDGNDLDAWDPRYIRRVLPAWRALMGVYFRPEVRGLKNIPEEGPALLVGNHSGGTLIADTFVFAAEFYAHFGPARRFPQPAHDLAARPPFTGLDRWGTVAGAPHTPRRAF